MIEMGIVGPKTISACEAKETDEVLRGLVQVCERRYNAIVEKDSSQGVFLKGWLRRAMRIPG